MENKEECQCENCKLLRGMKAQFIVSSMAEEVRKLKMEILLNENSN
jgi:hypothetical protein